MTKNKAWENFKKTGKVTDYLKYKQETKEG